MVNAVMVSKMEWKKKATFNFIINEQEQSKYVHYCTFLFTVGLDKMRRFRS